ncbi:50S ribosomal protein L29 [Fibrella forsythiae]|uniref:Large ribosomal subunit protein uL29 n=1 Tax=Fibrella forsythiae TaxID=2817061 RepID=A0ABS3JL88_9BACT|nr:50S ribosomal protein L29 [Fibrella forsythiae]MBO0949667.1 50S ribosomal protein L29 [Fibrella forsythiae]
MKKQDIKALSVDQLHEQISAEKQQLQKLNFAHAVSPIENPMRIRESRKLIARLYTELTQKENQA